MITKCDITDDDETLSSLDWVDATVRTAYNSTRVSRFDINQDDSGQHLVTTRKKILTERKKNYIFSFSYSTYSRNRQDFKA